MKAAGVAEMNRFRQPEQFLPVGAAGGGHREIAAGLGPLPSSDPLLCQPVGDILGLPGVFRKEIVHHCHPVRQDQCQILTGITQLEIRVQFAAGLMTVLSRGEHDQIFARSQFHLWKAPLGQPAIIIRQGPSLKLHRLSTGIEQLDPIRMIPIPVTNAGAVPGAEFGDQDGRNHGGGGQEPTAQKRKDYRAQHQDQDEPGRGQTTLCALNTHSATPHPGHILRTSRRGRGTRQPPHPPRRHPPRHT